MKTSLRKTFTKLSGLFLGLAMGLGVAVGVTAGNNKASEVKGMDSTYEVSPTQLTSVSNKDLVAWGPSNTELASSFGSNWVYLKTTKADWLIFEVETVATGGFYLKDTADNNYVYCSAAKKVEKNSSNKTLLNFNSTSDPYITTGSCGYFQYNSTGLRPYASQQGTCSKSYLYKVTSGTTPTESYTISFNGNGNTGGSMTNGSFDKFPNCNYEKTGFIFKEWNTSYDGTGDSYKPNDAVTSNIEVWAIWEKNPYVEYTATISCDVMNNAKNSSDFYDTGTRSFSVVATADGGLTKTVNFSIYYFGKNTGGATQFYKGSGCVWNTTELYQIISVTVSKDGSFTTYYGSTVKPTSGTTVSENTKFFNVKCTASSGTNTVSSITFKFRDLIPVSIDKVTLDQTSSVKDSYATNDSFNPSGLKLNVHMDDESSDTIVYSQSNSSDFAFYTNTALTSQLPASLPNGNHTVYVVYKGFKGTVENPVPSISITVSDHSMEISGNNSVLAGDSINLSLSHTGTTTTNDNVSWSITEGSNLGSLSNQTNSGATLNTKKNGSITVKAACGHGGVDEFDITVLAHTLKFADDQPSSVRIGESITLNASHTDGKSDTISYSIVSGEQYANLVGNTLTGKGTAGGTVTVKATCPCGGETTKDITVVYTLVDSVSLGDGESELTKIVFDEFDLHASVSPSDATVKTITWESSDSDIATVDNDGHVKTLKTGNVTITAKGADNKSASCSLTINKIPVTNVSITGAQNYVYTEFTLDLAATVEPSSASYPEVTWTSSNEEIATVDENGTVLGMNEGDVVIYATADGIVGQYNLKVKNMKVTGVVCDEEKTIMIGENHKQQIQAIVSPDDAFDTSVSWSSNNPEVATVDSDGYVTGISAGEAIITVTTTDGGFTDTCSVTIIPVPVTGITLSKTSATIFTGNEVTLNATVSPSDAANKNVAWSSSDESVASVSGGVVKALKVGSATITATTEDQGKTATCSVTVSQSNASLEVKLLNTSISDKSSQYFKVGEEKSFVASMPNNTGSAASASIVWSVGDDTKGTFTQSGNTMKVSNLSGDTTITASVAGTDYYEGKSVTINVKKLIMDKSFSSYNWKSGYKTKCYEGQNILSNRSLTSIKLGWNDGTTVTYNSTSNSLKLNDTGTGELAINEFEYVLFDSKKNVKKHVTSNSVFESSDNGLFLGTRAFYDGVTATYKPNDAFEIYPIVANEPTYEVSGLTAAEKNYAFGTEFSYGEAILTKTTTYKYDYPTKTETFPLSSDNIVLKIENEIIENGKILKFIGTKTVDVYLNGLKVCDYQIIVTNVNSNDNVGITSSHTYIDTLTADLFVATSTQYKDFSGVVHTNDNNILSTSEYAGNNAKNGDSIQLRDNSNAGIVQTVSGGKVKKVIINWANATTSGRTIDVYGKNTAYESSADLFDSKKSGTKLGSIVYGTSTEFTITGDYDYIGIRSNKGALYIASMQVYVEGTITYNALPTEQATAWADYLVNQTRGENGPCLSIDHQTKINGLKSIWGELESEYLAMDDASKDYFCSDEASSEIKTALAHYQYIISQYECDEINDFIVDSNGKKPSRMSQKKFQIINEVSDSTWIITIIALAGIAATGGYFFIRKRKED